MKTLTQVEPRTLISSVPYFITNSGSYYLTGDLIGTPGQAGIVISASGVSIDLTGFSVVGSSNGIGVSGAGLGGVSIRNGAVRQCVGPGINLGSVKRCQIEHVLVSDNGGSGMIVGSAALIDLCTASGNNGIGISAGDGSSVFSCVVQSNTADGIVVTAQSRVAENTCDSNGSAANQAGVRSTGAGNRIEANNLSRNNAHGIRVEGTNNLVIKNSSCSNTGTDYDIAAGNNYGQILVGPGAGFVNSNPWANFSCAAVVAGCVNDSQCDDGNSCTTDLCDSVAHTCSHPSVANGTACAGGTCNNGVCQPSGTCSSAADCPGVDTTCSFRTCTAGSCGMTYAAAGTACNDGSACTTGDTCNGIGQCTGTAVVCNDNNPCTSDSCNPATGTCSYSILPDLTVCPGGTCHSGVCTASGGCASAADCPGADTACSFRTCTAGTCGMSFAPLGTACSDGNACTIGDTCNGTGSCNGGSPVYCGSNGNPCTYNGTCNPATGACSYPNAPDLTACPGGTCHSGVCTGSCTTDANCATNQYCSGGNCVPKVGVGAACTGNNVCASGVCQFGFCQGASCTDLIKNGTETDVDCGGGTCATCVNGKTCGANADCQSGLCQGGVCTVSCPGGQFNCSGTCYNLNTDVNNCGTCGHICSTANGAAACTAGNCTIASCNAGFADCDGNPADGCEINLNSNVNNCGSCGHLCSAPNANSACAGGACVITSCNAGFLNCDGSPANGCEVSVNTDPINCGSCGTVCSSSHITPTCAGGVCNGVCTTGFADCNGNKQTDGCETSIATSATNCGGCGTVCSANHITAPTCAGSVCNGVCASGFADCNGNKQSDGCEINLTNDHNNCGSCGHVCTVSQNCISSICQ